MRGESISYLEDYDLSLGSPFDYGRNENISLYFNPPKEIFYLWEGKKSNLLAIREKLEKV